MVGHITAVYRVLALAKVRPQVESTRGESASSWVPPFSAARAMCEDHLILLSTQTPSTLSNETGFPSKPWMLVRAVTSAFLLLVKWMSLYFVGAKAAPCRHAHARHRSCIWS